MAEKPAPGSIEDPATDLPGPDLEEGGDLAEEDFFAADTVNEDPLPDSAKPQEGAPAAPPVEPVTPAAPATPPAPVAAPVAPTAPTVPTPEAPAPVAGAPTEPVAPAAPAHEAHPVPTAADLAASKASFIEGLIPQYAFSPEEAEQLAVEPQSILPKLAARVHANLFEDVYRTFSAQLPQLVMGVLDGQKRIEDAKSTFYGDWPELKGQEETVARVGQVYHQMYPTATTEQRRKAIGSMAMMELGLARGTVAPAAPAAPAPARPSAPHRPRAAGITAPAQPGQPTPNVADVWASLIPE